MGTDDKDILEHHGVLGMKWGVRKPEGAPPGPASSVVKKSTKRGIKTAGGENNPASEDAIKAALSKQQAKKSGTHSLSNQELQTLVNRMNLEQNYSRLLDGDPKSKRAEKFVKQVLGVKTDKGYRIDPGDAYLADQTAKGIKKAQSGARAAQGLGNDLKKVKL